MSLLLSIDLNNKLEEEGYACVPVLQKEDIALLKQSYEENTKENFQGFHPTMFHNSVDYRKNLNEIILKTLKPYLTKLMSDQYQALYGNFMVKEANSDSRMKLHQDWTYVNEPNHKSYAIWIPLIDLSESNGVFSVIPKSHKLNNHVRGPGTTCPLQDFEHELINQFGKNLFLRAGEAVIWDHKLAHYSPPNLSKETRIAITAIMVPKGIPALHYFKDPHSNQIFEYEVNDQFYMNYQIGSKPSLVENRVIPESKLTLNMQDFQKLLS